MHSHLMLRRCIECAWRISNRTLDGRTRRCATMPAMPPGRSGWQLRVRGANFWNPEKSWSSRMQIYQWMVDSMGCSANWLANATGIMPELTTIRLSSLCFLCGKTILEQSNVCGQSVITSMMINNWYTDMRDCCVLIDNPDWHCSKWYA